MKKILPFIILIFTLMPFVGARASSSHKLPSLNNFRLNGLMTYDTHKDGNIFGHYSYSVKNPAQRELLVAMPFVTANGGAVYRDGKFYLYNYDVQFGDALNAVYTVYDATTGELLKTKDIRREGAHTAYMNAATSVAASATSDDVYACSYSYDAHSGSLNYVLTKWDLGTLSKDSIAPLDRGMRVMAIAADGTLYGITMKSYNGTDAEGMLVKIDTVTGQITPIGDTGVKPDFFQSATIDKDTGTLYWFAVTADQRTILYTIDLNTGTAAEAGELPFADQVLAAYVPQAEAVDGVPSPAFNLALSFPQGNLTGTVAFDVPNETYDGQPLTGDLTYQVLADGEVIVSGTAQAGSHIDATATVRDNGLYRIDVVLVNAFGKSPAVHANLYIGQDAPLAVTGVAATRENQVNTIKWKAPQGTVNGGYMDLANATYNVMRLPDSTMVASMLKDTMVADEYTTEYLSTCKYAVTPSNGNLVGETALSNAVKVGDCVPLPYSEDFSDEATFDMFTVLNSNGDANTWGCYRGTARYRSSFRSAADDWLLLPPVKLVKGYSYRLTYDVAGSSTRNVHRLTVAMGDSPTAEGMKLPLKDLTEYKNRTPLTEEIIIKPDSDSIYYIGFHVTSESNQGNFSLDNIKISAGISGEVPAGVENLAATPATGGELQVTVSFSSPSLNENGQPLTDLAKFEISRNGEKIGEIEAVSSQVQDYAFIDTTATAGINVYTVVACNTFGTGAPVNDTTYVGIDTPQAPSQLNFVDNYDGTGLLRWPSVPALGIHGGYVDPSAVTYDITDDAGNTVAKSVPALSFNMSGLYTGSPQQEVAYSITASNTAGSSSKTSTDVLLLGEPYHAPYVEGFDHAEYQNGPWRSTTLAGKSYDAKWSPRTDQDQDGNGGSADFQGSLRGGIARLTSPKIDVSQLAKPTLGFWYLFNQPGKTHLTLQVSTDFGEWKDIAVISDREVAATLAVGEDSTEWRYLEMPLPDFKSQNVRLGFLAECLADFNFAYIDHVEVFEGEITGICDTQVHCDDNVQVITMNGIVVKQGKKSSIRLDDLPRGLYIVKEGQAVRKVFIGR